MNPERNKSEQDSLILYYAAISSKILQATSPEEIEKIEAERRELEERLGMTNEEIIVEAKRLTVG
jgi:hypothetical protein